MRQLDSGNRDSSVCERLETLHPRTAALDRAVILLNDIVEGLAGPHLSVFPLEHGSFRLTECSAILKYLADKAGAAQYPKDLQARARVNERMDWVNTQLARELCYGVVYPQIFDFAQEPTGRSWTGRGPRRRRARTV